MNLALVASCLQDVEGFVFSRPFQWDRAILGSCSFTSALAGVVATSVRGLTSPRSLVLDTPLLQEEAALTPGRENETRRIQMLLQGQVPPKVRPWIRGASLLVLRKLHNTLRPIGVAVRRIIGKAAQVGVRTPNGF